MAEKPEMDEDVSAASLDYINNWRSWSFCDHHPRLHDTAGKQSKSSVPNHYIFPLATENGPWKWE